MVERVLHLWRAVRGALLGAALGYLLWRPQDAAGCAVYRAGQATPTGALRVETGDRWACTNLLGLDMWGSIDGGRLTPFVAALALALVGLLVNAAYRARTE